MSELNLNFSSSKLRVTYEDIIYKAHGYISNCSNDQKDYDTLEEYLYEMEFIVELWAYVKFLEGFNADDVLLEEHTFLHFYLNSFMKSEKLV